MSFLDKPNNEIYISFVGITQKDIARDLGISFITVNRAFNNSEYVSAKLKKRVLDYAREKKYIPHRASQILVRNKVRTIALFTSDWPLFFWSDIEKGAMIAAEYLKSLNYNVRFHKIPANNTEKYCNLLRREIRNGLDAAAFVYQGFFDMDMIINIVERASIPFLMYNTDDPKKRGFGYIGSNNNKGGRLAANFIGKVLESRLKPNVLIIDSKYNFFPNPYSQRLEGFISVMKEQYPFIQYSIDYINTDSEDPRIELQFQHILGKKGKKPDAIYYLPSSHTQFFHFLEKNDYRQSIIVQHDIDDASVTSLENKLVTAVVYQDPVMQGYMVVRTLEKVLESKKLLPRKEMEISHTLIFRENIDFSSNHFLFLEPNEPFIQN